MKINFNINYVICYLLLCLSVTFLSTCDDNKEFDFAKSDISVIDDIVDFKFKMTTDDKMMGESKDFINLNVMLMQQAVYEYLIENIEPVKIVITINSTCEDKYGQKSINEVKVIMNESEVSELRKYVDINKYIDSPLSLSIISEFLNKRCFEGTVIGDQSILQEYYIKSISHNSNVSNDKSIEYSSQNGSNIEEHICAEYGYKWLQMSDGNGGYLDEVNFYTSLYQDGTFEVYAFYSEDALRELNNMGAKFGGKIRIQGELFLSGEWTIRDNMKISLKVGDNVILWEINSDFQSAIERDLANPEIEQRQIRISTNEVGKNEEKINSDNFKILPRNEMTDDKSLVEFINKVQSIVRNRNSAELLAIIDDDIQLDIMKNDFSGKDQFIKIWELNKSKSKFWPIIESYLKLGGVFFDTYDPTTRVVKKDKNGFYIPYCASFEIPEAEVGVITGSNVNLRDKPNLNSNVIGQLSYEVVWLEERGTNIVTSGTLDNGNPEWYMVNNSEGLKGWIYHAYIYKGGVVFFRKNDQGKWSISQFR